MRCHEGLSPEKHYVDVSCLGETPATCRAWKGCSQKQHGKVLRLLELIFHSYFQAADCIAALSSMFQGCQRGGGDFLQEILDINASMKL